MLCARPFQAGAGQEFGCGQCMPCRVNKRRMWTARILLEQTQHDSSSFVTLTYADPPPHELQPRDCQLFMKRLRKRLDFSIRFFLVGEYGDKTFRPHYHAAIFGLDPGFSPWVNEAWGKGFIHVGELNASSAAYLAGYCTKKMTSPEDPRLGGRRPEFSRMSIGIGAPAIPSLAHGYVQKDGSKWLLQDGDVSPAVRIGGKLYPLGRTLRSKLREQVGWAPTMPSDVREASIQARKNWTPQEAAEHERKRAGGLRIAQSREKLARQRKTLQ